MKQAAIRSFVGSVVGLVIAFGLAHERWLAFSLDLTDLVLPVIFASLGGASVPAGAAVRKLGRRSSGLMLFLALLLALPVSSCAAGPLIANNPALMSIVQKALAWIGVVDSVVTTLLKDPNVPADWGDKYQALRYQFMQVALVVEELVAEGQESHQQTLDALAELQAIAEVIISEVRGVQPASRAEGWGIPEPRFSGRN